MKKKSFILVFGLAVVLFLCVVISGCLGNEDTEHAHEWETTLHAGGMSHWYACRGCNEKKSESFHEFDNGVCICGKWQLNYWVNDNNEACVTSIDRFLEPDSKVIIPAEYQGIPVTAIGESAFWDCSKMIEIEIPNSVTRIEERAFQRCCGLTSIVIPKSMTHVSGNAFLECSNLTSIEVDSENPVYKSENNCILTADGQTLVVGWISEAIPDGITCIGDNAFEGRSDLKNLEIPASVTSIGKGAFRDCGNLASIVVDGANPTYKSENDCILTVDGKTLVLGCENSVIPEGVTHLGDYALAGCSGLETLMIPMSITGLGDGVFSGCTWLKALSISGDIADIRIESVGKGIFSGCRLLEQIEIPFGVTEIPDETFQGCERLKSVAIPNGVTAIGIRAFYGCKQLKNIEIPSTVTSIESYAFAGCESLESVELPDSITSLGSRAFFDCKQLKTVKIPSGVTVIETSTFERCSLESVVISEGVTCIKTDAFKGLSSLVRMEIPVSVTKIEDGAFSCSYTGEIRIDYKGTKAEWAAIEKEDSKFISFSYQSPAECTVYCTDGEIKIRG